MHGHRFGFFGGDGFDDQGAQVIIIQQPQPAPAAEPSKPPENRIYVQPRWVDGGYGVHPLAGRSRGKDLSYRKNFILSLFFLLAEFVIFR